MQKDTVEVIINEGGLTCTTTNRFGEKPKIGDFKDHVPHIRALQAFYKAESERKTYEIASCDKKCPSWCGMPCFEPGTVHQARIINNKAVIL